MKNYAPVTRSGGPNTQLLKTALHQFVEQTQLRLDAISESVSRCRLESQPVAEVTDPVAAELPTDPATAAIEFPPAEAEFPERSNHGARPLGDPQVVEANPEPASSVESWCETTQGPVAPTLPPHEVEPTPQGPSPATDSPPHASTATSDESDPTDRLNAIKRRLAQQIENA